MAATQVSKKSGAVASHVEIQPESLLDEIKREVSEYSYTQQNFRGKKSNSGTVAKPEPEDDDSSRSAGSGGRHRAFNRTG